MTTSAGLVRGVLTLGAAQVLSWLGAVALVVVLPRYLGDVGLGKFAFAFALTRLTGLLAELGAATYLAKTLAKQDASGQSSVAAAFLMRAPLSLMAAGAALLTAEVGAHDEVTRSVVRVLALGIVLDSTLGIVQGTLQGRGRMRAYAACGLTSKLGFAAAATAALLSGGGPTEVAVAWLAAQALGVAAGIALLGRPAGLRRAIDGRAWRAVFVGGLPFFIWQGALLVYGQIDAVILSFLSGDAVVGWYSAAYRIVTIPAFVPAILVTVLLPALAASSGDARRFAVLTRQAVRYVVLLTVPMGIGLALLPDRVVSLLGYPPAFAASIVPIVLLAPSLPLIAVDMIIGTALIAADRQRRWAVVAIVAALLNPLANLIAIPYAQAGSGNGASGAAAVTTLTELFILAAGLALLPRGVLDASVAGAAGRAIVAGLIMAVAVVATREHFIAVPIVVGAVVYLASALLLRAIRFAEIRELGHVLLLRHPIPVRAET